VSPWTNWLVVAARPDGEKALDIPALRKVPQTLAAGWGGVGALASRLSPDLMPALSAEYSRRDVAAAEFAGLARDSRDRLSEIRSDLSRPLQDLNRGAETLAEKAQRAVESLQEHAQEAERQLRAMENQVAALRNEIETLQSRADVLRRQIGDVEGRADYWCWTTEGAVETWVLESQLREAIQKLAMRLADCGERLVQLEKLVAHLQERRVLLGHLQELAREWTEGTMRYRHLAEGVGRNWR
jgi:chromosome segregation ATPase